jgi:hypothetical protein
MIEALMQKTTPVVEEGEMDLVAMWLVFDLPRTIAGAMAGVFAGLVALVFAGILSMIGHLEFLYPFKIGAAPILGREALDFGFSGAVILGTLVSLVLCAILGMVYSHFTKTNRLVPLLGAGFMWGTFSWIFINNLFTKSFLNIRELDLPAGPAFFVYLVFGFSLASIRIFDRAICGRTR